MEPKASGENGKYWWQQAAATAAVAETAVSDVCLLRPPRPGDACPFCAEGALAYDGLFVLSCRRCGKAAESGCFT
ncbi:MAG: hypothetical protein KC425_10780 [Anaerolineales bacterium]|nr:hypothetical protein [Anaerolineales bacterium]